MIYSAVWGLSCCIQALQSSFWYEGSLVEVCKLPAVTCGIYFPN